MNISAHELCCRAAISIVAKMKCQENNITLQIIKLKFFWKTVIKFKKEFDAEGVKTFEILDEVTKLPSKFHETVSLMHTVNQGEAYLPD
jgi:hypothetical protein